MSDESFTCWYCNTKIVVYFHKKYNGKRGKCPNCGVDFPLE